MQDLIDAAGYDLSQIEPNIAAYYTTDSGLYSMPFNSSTPLLYYNKDMFEAAGITEIPTSLDEIAEVGDALLSDGGAQEVLAMSVYGWWFEQFLSKQGAAMVDNDNGRTAPATKVVFDENGAALNILEAWMDLNEGGWAPNVGRSGSDTATTDFTSGKAAMMLGSTASLKQVLQDTGDSFEVGTAYYPAVHRRRGRRVHRRRLAVGAEQQRPGPPGRHLALHRVHDLARIPGVLERPDRLFPGHDRRGRGGGL